MKLKIWGLFVVVQLLGCALLTVHSPLLLRWAAGVLLFPSSVVIIVFGQRMANLIQVSLAREFAAVVIFACSNGCAWYVASRCFRKLTDTQTNSSRPSAH